MEPKDRDEWTEFERRCLERGLSESLERIVREHHSTLREVHGPSKTRLVARARAACFAFMHERGFGHIQIGEMWGRDHTSSAAAIKKHRARSSASPPAPLDLSTAADERIDTLEKRVAVLEKTLRMLRAALKH